MFHIVMAQFLFCDGSANPLVSDSKFVTCTIRQSWYIDHFKQRRKSMCFGKFVVSALCKYDLREEAETAGG